MPKRGIFQMTTITNRKFTFRHIRQIGQLFLLVWRTNPTLSLLLILLRLIAAVVPVAILYIAKLLIDEIIMLSSKDLANFGFQEALESGVLDKVIILIVIEMFVVLVSDIVTRWVSAVGDLLGEQFSNKASILLMQHTEKLTLLQLEDSELQDQLQRARLQAESRGQLVNQVMSQFQELISVASFLMVLFNYSPLLTIILVCSYLPLAFVELKFNGRTYALNYAHTLKKRELIYMRQLGTDPSSAKEIKMNRLIPYLVSRFSVVSQKILIENRSIIIQKNIWGTALASANTAVYYFVSALVIWRTLTGEFTIGDWSFIAGTMHRLRGILRSAMLGVVQIVQQALFLDDFFSFLRTAPTSRIPPTKPDSAPIPSAMVSFDKVGFKYPGSERWVVRNLSFQLLTDKTLAIVGENGAGKSTIIKLMTGLYHPVEGNIYINGVDIASLDECLLQKTFSVVFQDFNRYEFTAGENIAVGHIKEKENQARIVSASKSSLADSIIKKLPKLYQQRLGKVFQDGMELSGGEWQKISIARAYMHDAAIIILDEPTSALDAKSELEVFTRFKKLSKGKSAVLISHRFSTVRMADHIIVLQGGEIVEEGNHKFLVSTKGVYSELYEMQASQYR